MRLPGGFHPPGPEYWRQCIAREILCDLGDFCPIGKWLGLRINLRPSNDPELGRQGGQAQGMLKAISALCAFGLPVVLPGNHDVAATRQWAKSWRQ